MRTVPNRSGMVAVHPCGAYVIYVESEAVTQTAPHHTAWQPWQPGISIQDFPSYP